MQKHFGYKKVYQDVVSEKNARVQTALQNLNEMDES